MTEDGLESVPLKEYRMWMRMPYEHLDGWQRLSKIYSFLTYCNFSENPLLELESIFFLLILVSFGLA